MNENESESFVFGELLWDCFLLVSTIVNLIGLQDLSEILLFFYFKQRERGGRENENFHGNIVENRNYSKNDGYDRTSGKATKWGRRGREIDFLLIPKAFHAQLLFQQIETKNTNFKSVIWILTFV